jgi:hypothetical protein
VFFDEMPSMLLLKIPALQSRRYANDLTVVSTSLVADHRHDLGERFRQPFINLSFFIKGPIFSSGVDYPKRLAVVVVDYGRRYPLDGIRVFGHRILALD